MGSLIFCKFTCKKDWQLSKTPFDGWYIGGQCPRLKDYPKNKQLAEKGSLEGNCQILRRIFQPRALSHDIPASRKGVYLCYNPPNDFSRRTHLDRFCVFCGFFVFLCVELSTTFLISPSMVSARSILLFSMTSQKFSLNACSFLGLYSVEI